MTQELHKFTKYMFLVGGIVPLTFTVAFIFLWEWFFRGVQQWPFDDPAMPRIFAGAVFCFAVMGLLVFFTVKNWSEAKIPLITFLVFAWGGIPINLYLQFTYTQIHNWHWFNTLSYLVVAIGFTVALILQIRKNKSTGI